MSERTGNGKRRLRLFVGEVMSAGRALLRVRQVDGPLETPCFVWQGSLTHNGYATDGTGRVHAILYRVFVGAVAKGKELHHRCDNRACVNWSHLEQLTRKEHTLLGKGLGARAAWTHCSHGHEFTPGNTKVRPNGTRECRACWTERKRKQKARAIFAEISRVQVAR